MEHINTKEELRWWKTLDKNCEWLSKLYCRMYGSSKQRISQLYIIRNNQNFTLKAVKSYKKE